MTMSPPSNPVATALEAQVLLTEIAEAFSRMERLGFPVSLRHGVVVTSAGYVVPGHTYGWSVWAKTVDPYQPMPSGDELDS